MAKRFDLFLSYSSIDGAWALRLKHALEARGLTVWLDQDEIRPGDLFVSALEQGLKESRAIALLVSPESLHSRWAQEEYARALGMTHEAREPVQLIPVILRGTELPGFLSNRSCVDFRDEAQFEQSLDLLVFGATGARRKGIADRALPWQVPQDQRPSPTAANNALFEGLFARLLKPEGDFAADLRAVGYDPRHPKALYPNSVFLAALNVAHRHVYPKLERLRAHRRLGRRFAKQYFETKLGKQTLHLVKSMGMEQFLLSFPKIFAVISPGSYAQVQRIAAGPFQIVMRGDSIAADFMAGTFEGAAWLMSIPIRIEVIRREPEYEWVVEALTPKHLPEHWTRRLMRRNNPEPTPAIEHC